MKKMYLAE